MKAFALFFGIVSAFTIVNQTFADIAWGDWTAAHVSIPTGTASGTIIAPGGPISVSYSGEVAAATQVSGGINYWLPNTPYLSATVPNEPPASDIIALSGAWGVTSRLTFSAPVTNPLMAIVSLGTPEITVTYAFDHPFDVVSFGPGYWPGPGTLTELPGNVLRGVEGHGVIQFQGTFSTLSWTIPTGEYWNGFTIGLVPEPSTALLLLVGVGGARRYVRGGRARRSCRASRR